jgi:hypothetical protein
VLLRTARPWMALVCCAGSSRALTGSAVRLYACQLRDAKEPKCGATALRGRATRWHAPRLASAAMSSPRREGTAWTPLLLPMNATLAAMSRGACGVACLRQRPGRRHDCCFPCEVTAEALPGSATASAWQQKRRTRGLTRMARFLEERQRTPATAPGKIPSARSWALLDGVAVQLSARRR